MTVTELFADEVGPVASPSLLEGAEPVSWQGLSALPLLHTRTRLSAWVDWCAMTGHSQPDGGQEFEHFYFLLGAATAGLCVAMAPEVLVRDDLSAGRLIATFGFAPSGQTYVALTPNHPTAEARAFTGWLAAQVKKGETA